MPSLVVLSSGPRSQALSQKPIRRTSMAQFFGMYHVGSLVSQDAKNLSSTSVFIHDYQNVALNRVGPREASCQPVIFRNTKSDVNFQFSGGFKSP